MINSETESILCLWVASLLDRGLQHRTVSQYMAGVKYHWGSMCTNHADVDNMVALQRELQAAKKTNSAAVRTRLALGHEQLIAMKPFIRNEPDDAMINMRSLVINMQRLLTAAGVPNANQYTGHSFRRGGATALANSNTSMHIIQKAGRWTSNAAQRYIDTSASDVAAAQVRAAQSVSSVMGSASSTRR